MRNKGIPSRVILTEGERFPDCSVADMTGIPVGFHIGVFAGAYSTFMRRRRRTVLCD